MRAPLEVADIFRHCGPRYRQMHADGLSRAQRRAMSAIELCRTAALGGHVEQCDACAHQRITYNSCRHRGCPKCQSLARAQWLEDRQAELLPEVEYFHVVFTVPEPIAALAYHNKKLLSRVRQRSHGVHRNLPTRCTSACTAMHSPCSLIRIRTTIGHVSIHS
jgi:hypothetical protein